MCIVKYIDFTQQHVEVVTLKNQAYRMSMLFDFYGEVLTDRQKEFYDLYYNEDLSLAEIAENYNISRQGVRDAIVRAEGILTDLEDKTGIIRRFKLNQEELLKLELQLDEVTGTVSNSGDTGMREAELTLHKMKEELIALRQGK
ncbi:MAG: YlxM family DNA-binding protein [Oscillospiraceae bacterium]